MRLLVMSVARPERQASASAAIAAIAHMRGEVDAKIDAMYVLAIGNSVSDVNGC